MTVLHAEPPPFCPRCRAQARLEPAPDGQLLCPSCARRRRYLDERLTDNIKAMYAALDKELNL